MYIYIYIYIYTSPEICIWAINMIVFPMRWNWILFLVHCNMWTYKAVWAEKKLKGRGKFKCTQLWNVISTSGMCLDLAPVRKKKSLREGSKTYLYVNKEVCLWSVCGACLGESESETCVSVTGGMEWGSESESETHVERANGQHASFMGVFCKGEDLLSLPSSW